MNRRDFISALAGSATAAGCVSERPPLPRPEPRKSAGRGARRRTVALLATEVKRYSHAQHFIDRFLEGYGWQGRHHYPPFELSLYVDQFPEGDLSADRARRHGVKIYPTIAEALTLGRSSLAVDGVLIIGEHGRYPKNEKGQTLYPRYQWFKEVVKVFEASGRAAPVFNDKHLSTDWAECVEMVADSRRLGFPFLAGSSLPVTWRIPSIEMPLGTALEESVCACYGGVDSYDFHGLETAQCMSERRAGGESGVKSVHAAKGERIWELLAERRTTQRLLLAALSRSHAGSAPAGYTFAAPSLDWVRRASVNTVAYFIEHLDGLRTTMFLLNGTGDSAPGPDQKTRDLLWASRFVRDFTYAGLVRGSGEVISCKFHLPMPPWHATLADFFNPLVHHVEDMILTGRAPYPVERTLLTSGMTLFGVESLHRGQTPVPTPELKVAYTPPAGSRYWRA